MSLSEIVASVLEPLFDLLPRINPRPAANERGVVDSWLRSPRLFAGPLLTVPVLSHVEYWSAVEVPVDTGLQTLTTADGKVVCVNATTILKVKDPILLRTITDFDEWEVWVSMKVRGIVQEVITAHNWQHSLHKAAEYIEADAYDELIDCGIFVCVVVLEDSCESIPLRLLQSDLAAE